VSAATHAPRPKPARTEPGATRPPAPTAETAGEHALALALYPGAGRAAAPPPPPGARVLRRKCAQCAAAEELEARTGIPQPLCPSCAAEREAAVRLQRRADDAASAAAAGEAGMDTTIAPPSAASAPIYVGAADDPMERDADQAADRVMGEGPVPAPRSATAPASLRRASDVREAGVAPPQVHAALAEAGQPLDPVTRAFMEARFGRGFGGVRVHTGAAAEASARAVRAQAYTVGSRLVFGAGHYRPQTGEGRRLIAHELAHTVQQAGGAPALQRTSDPVLLKPVRPNARACVVHVHGNEPVAFTAAEQLYNTRCVNMAWIDHPGRRLIDVDVAAPGGGTMTCRADPNRIFDNTALHNQWGNWNTGPCMTTAGRAAGEAAVQAWRDTRLNVAIRQCRGQAVSATGVAGTGVSGGLPVLSMHNNTAAPSGAPPVTGAGTPGCRENLSIRSYLPNHCEAGATETDPARTHGHPNPNIIRGQDIDNFVLVTDPAAFDRLVAAGTRNAVLQKLSPTQDGSLSVAMASQNYGNVEVEQRSVAATNLAMGNAGLDALGVPPGPCASSTGADAPVGAPSTPTLPTPARGQITSARVGGGTAERTRFVRHVFDLQVAAWEAAGVPYTHAVPRLYTLSAPDTLPGTGTIQLDRGVARQSLEPMLRDARAALSAARSAGTPGAAGVTGLRVRSGYRSATSQLGIWTRFFPRYYEETAAHRASLAGGEHGEAAAQYLAAYANERVITPGYSPHQRAQTVDLTYQEGRTWAEADTSPAAVAAWRASWFFNWLAANAGSYGFRQNPALNEPWHWEHDPIGVLGDQIRALGEEVIDLLRSWISGDSSATDAPPPSDVPDAPPQPAPVAPVPQ
jgi:hypothetical protein